MPAAAAGESGWTAPTFSPSVGSPISAIPVKIANASNTFITTPATRMRRRFGRLWAENARGSSAASPS